MNLDGQSYSTSEEAAAHMVGDFVESRWNVYQADNTSLRASVPTTNANTNSYANNVEFGQLVNPLLPAVVATAYFAYKGNGNALKGMSETNDEILNSSFGKMSKGVRSII